MAPRKRAFSEVDAPEPPKETGLLDRIRNMWEFAAVMQYITTFGDVIKIDNDFDVNDLEDECMKPEPSDRLEDIGLCLLKWISSHRGLTLEIWDEYTRRQYLAKAPEKNPYGDEETPKKFREFDTFTKIRVLHQLTVWTFWNPDRIRERMPEQSDLEQTDWRIDEFGWDKEDRTYYFLDDSRLYRRTDPPIPSEAAWKPKQNTLKARAARRRDRKRRRTRADGSPDPEDSNDETLLEDDAAETKPSSEDNAGGFGWECICVTTQQYRDFVDSHRKSRDANERALIARIEADVMPILEKAEEAQLRKIQKRERELLAMEKLATAKRSSRLAGKHERERIEREQAEADKKRQADLAAARKLEDQQKKMQEERQYRMLTREQRIREREYKRILQEEALARLEEEARRIEAGETRGNRHLKATMEQTKKELEELQNDDEWMFDCAGCGKHGKNFDDGEHSIQCEKCNTWQHSKCYGVSQSEAEKDDFHFVCKDCVRREEDAKKPKIPPLKFRVDASSSPPAEPGSIHVAKKSRGRPRKDASLPGVPSQGAQSSPAVVPPTPTQQVHRAADGYSSPQQFAPPQSHGAPSPSPTKPTSYMNGVFQASPQRPSSSMANGLGYGTYGQMSPPPQLSHHGQPFPRVNPNHDEGSSSYLNSTPQQPRPSSSHSNQAVSGTPAFPRSMPSPLQNRPEMSPTQGNPEVGPLAGVPTPKALQPSMSPPPVPVTPQQYPAANSNGINHAVSHQQVPTESSSSQEQEPSISTPLVNHMSGRSPTKHSPPPEAAATRPVSASYGHPSARSVSATSIYPPSSTLAPSPKQLDNAPVPTPSKSMTPPTPVKQLDVVMTDTVMGDDTPGETEEMVRERRMTQEGHQQQQQPQLAATDNVNNGFE